MGGAHSATVFPALELRMQSRGEDRNGAAVTVESGVANKLVVERTVDVFGEFAIVVCFHDFFGGVIQGAVAIQDAQAAGLQVLPVNA